MKVLCVKDMLMSPYKKLLITVGKTYECIEEDDTTYIIINDVNYHSAYSKYLFKTVGDIREDKLKEILG